MAVIPTGAIYKTLNFDGQSSGTFGVYITGDAVFNAPERDVEMITIPGRNGAFALDNGRFENIEVTYPAGIFAETEADFAEAISDFRNYLCSRKGYCRLTDDYNPDEYRLGIYKSGLEVDPAFLKAGQFNITFECKPQRYLTTGENPITVTDGDTVTNPTYFESGPLLEVEGYGDIIFNGATISIENAVFGETQISEVASDSVKLDLTNCNIGDELYTKENSSYFGNLLGGWSIKITGKNGASIQGQTGGSSVLTNSTTNYIGTPFIKNYSATTDTLTVSYGGSTYSAIVSLTKKIEYDGVDTITLTLTVTKTGDGADYIDTFTTNKIYAFWCDSSVSTLGNPTFIDCDLGEAYKVENDEVISLNAYIDLGSQLPTLAPGSNTVTFDNTITDLKITPRWWKV